jgi:thymidine phosphorylase
MTASLLPQEILRRKRNGDALRDAEIQSLVQGISDGSLCDAQIGAFAMAVRLRGMDPAETLALTLAMRDSGRVLDWRAFDLPGPLLDKHSTGGVGDSVSLLLAPMLAACGAYVPMLSGRGLGHTGGTLDKLEALPGYRTRIGIDELQRVVHDTGLAIVGASSELAPADARLYAVRDVTATVDSISLITASILSKKLAAGSDALVLDVKTGSGATLTDPDEARKLAQTLVEVASKAGLKASAWITAMDQPLTDRVGNSLELSAVLDVLSGRSEQPLLLSLSLALGAELLTAGGLASGSSDAVARLRRTLATGDAAERFARMVAALGGPSDVFAGTNRFFAPAPMVAAVFAQRAGVVAGMDVRRIGMALVSLGAGRSHPEQAVDLRVGFTALARIGCRVDAERPLALVHAADQHSLLQASDALRNAFHIVDQAPQREPPLLHERIAPPAAEAA